MKRLAVVSIALALTACPKEPVSPDGPDVTRPVVTPAECSAQGGHVVGDIGSGAIFDPSYRCPGSNQPPLGNITVEPGQPIPIEGAVCCPGAAAQSPDQGLTPNPQQ